MYSNKLGSSISIKKKLLIVCLLMVWVSGNGQVLAQKLSTTDDRPNGSNNLKAEVPTSLTRSLSQLIEEALAHNPEIKAMQRNYDMSRARIPQAKAMPQPMLSIGYLGNLAPIPPFDIQRGDPSSGRIINFSQELPFPGKLALKGKMAAMEAESQWWEYEQIRLNLVAEVKEVYFEFCYLNKAIDTIRKNKDLLEKFAKIAAARYAVGKGIQQDILKAEVEISKLMEQLLVLEQRKQSTVARLNNLIYRELDTPLAIAEEISPKDFPYTLTDLNEIALSTSPILKMQKRKIDREQYNIQLAQKEYYPDMSASFIYQNRPGMPEMYGLSFGVKLPLYFWQKQRPAVTEATASAAMERKRLDNAVLTLLFKIKDKYLMFQAAEKLTKLYATVIIPQSSLSIESAIAGYETGKVDFLTLLDSLTTLLNYQLSYYEQLSNVEKSLAQLEPLVGKTIRQ